MKNDAINIDLEKIHFGNLDQIFVINKYDKNERNRLKKRARDIRSAIRRSGYTKLERFFSSRLSDMSIYRFFN